MDGKLDSMLNLYRRHLRDHQCAAGHPGDSMSYEADERRRDRKKCFCPIYASGTLTGKFRRKNTKCIEWAEAKTLAAAWTARGSWDEVPPLAGPPVPPSPDPSAPKRIRIGEAIEKYLAEHEAAGSAELTIKSYQERTRAFAAFSTERGYDFLDEWTVRDVIDYRAGWKNAPLTRQAKLGWVRTFFNYALMREWIDRNPAAAVSAKGIGRLKGGVRVQRSPFTGEDIDRLFDACEKLGGRQWWNGTARGSWTGRDLADFITVSIYTGLRISDVVTFDIGRMKGNLIFLKQHKTKKPLLTWVPDWVRDLILARASVHGPQIFRTFTRSSPSVKVMTNNWRNKLRKVFRLAAPLSGGRPTPHRFRHTFVRILLEHGVSVETAAELAGDTPQVIREHYAEWCQERQDRLSQELERAFATQSKPRLISGGKHS